jgi:polyisoprenyl-phosphate glycosyltransferase
LKPLISIIIPVYDEAPNLAPLHSALVDAISGLPYQFELIFVDDGSTDRTTEILSGLAEHDKRVMVIELSRNFGKELATTAGLHQAKGRAAILIDGDLQHPPQLIPEFIDKWEAGADVVVGVRSSTNHDSWLKRTGSRWFYRVLKLISQTDIVSNATDYRLLDRVIIDEFNRFTEHNRLTRGLVDWLGFRHDYVYFQMNPRRNGRAGYGPRKLTRLAINSIIAHSMVPLRLAGYLGVAITCVSGTLGLFIYVDKYLLGDPFGYGFTGPAILAVMIVFLSGITLSCLGLIALYIANIHTEVINRPLYVVRRKRAARKRSAK